MWIEGAKHFLSIIGNKKFPIDVVFVFTRSTNQIWDYIGPGETVLDLMEEFKWIPDDSVRSIKPHFGDAEVDKENPGVLIKIL